ncbi:hypothetical protein MtrunA17_Chr4g0019881 [Medicago truncatula]|uniref:Transmembrane protein n=1 Tax=Medicago truncatula TaxID=3880 RepID=A0A396I2V2_MEDTR|nr:hypothetical protein MtrunA17_Chr4g0019881 [Medicago truncatula]
MVMMMLPVMLNGDELWGPMMISVTVMMISVTVTAMNRNSLCNL